MFVAQAHSFAQQARLAITLAWVAGYTNLVTILACGHVTSHMSGVTSELGRDLAEGTWCTAGSALFLLGVFVLGAFVSGVSTEVGRRRGWDSVYVVPMIIEAALLGGFAVLLGTHAGEGAAGWMHYLLLGLAASAMGVQNATITRISSGVVRTTHVTGVVTDLGLELAQVLLSFRGDARHTGKAQGVGGVGGWHVLSLRPALKRLALLASILGSFALGAGLGTLAYEHAASLAMLVPVLFLVWIIFQDLRRPIAELEAAELLAEQGLGLPAGLAVYQARPDRHHRAGKGGAGQQRLPDLVAWADRLPEGTRVAVLDLAAIERIDANSALVMRAARARLAEREVELLLAGITVGQFDEICRAAPGEWLEAEDVCPDLELAIAKGMNLLDRTRG